MYNKLIIWLCLSCLVACQVDDQGFKIRLLEVSNANYLEAVGSLVKDKEIVVLGEQDHGDGSVITLKTELVKYLHENQGFDILIFESDFFSLIKNKGDVHSLDNVLKVWKECEQFDALEDYYQASLQSENALAVLGIDNIHFTDLRKSSLVEFFQSFTSTRNEGKSEFKDFLQVIEKFERSGIFTKLSEDEVWKLEELSNILSTQSNFEARLANQELSNLISVYENGKGIWSGQTSNNIRDSQMFRNFVWLKENIIGDRKCIIWTTNSHGHRDFKSVRHLTPFERDTTNFGTLLGAKFPNKSYHIGFSSLSGSYGRFYLENQPIKTRKNSLEHHFYEVSNSSTVFLDFNKLGQFYPDSTLTMSPFGHVSLNGQWFNLFDGLILVKEMEPCEADKLDF